MSTAPDAVELPDHDLYRKLVLAHARAPHNFGPLTTATHTAHGVNQLCGDKLSLYLEVDANGHIDAVRFEGTGCAISLASASMLTDAVKDLGLEDAEELQRLVVDMLEAPAGQDTDASDEALRPLLVLSGVRQFPSRVKCATLAWQALQRAITNGTDMATQTVSTE